LEEEMNAEYRITQNPTEEECKSIQQRVTDHKTTQTNGEYNQPGVQINLVLKDSNGNVVGGVIAGTEFRVMYLEVFWVSEVYRRKRYGALLVQTAEQIARSEGCCAAQTWTFAFQGLEFYPAIGYTEIGIYDGYPNGLTEHVFGKPLTAEQNLSTLPNFPDENGITLSKLATSEELDVLHRGLMAHVKQNIGRDDDDRFSIKLVAKDPTGCVVGGAYGWATLQNLIFEYLWVDEPHRNKGLGTRLMNETEMIARGKGCIASQAYAFSFQAPGFFEKLGYQVLGISEHYPPPTKEYYFIKKYQ
jgi:GNAT superfamily N-acetyltransferase